MKLGVPKFFGLSVKHKKDGMITLKPKNYTQTKKFRIFLFEYINESNS